MLQLLIYERNRQRTAEPQLCWRNSDIGISPYPAT